MAFSGYEVFRVACLSRLRDRQSQVRTTPQTLKAMQETNLCSQGKFELHSKSEIVSWVSRLIVIRELKAKTTVTATRTSKKQ